MARLQFRCSELQSVHLNARVLGLPFFELGVRDKQQHIRECLGFCPVGKPQFLDFLLVRILLDHRREFRPVIHRGAVMEDHSCQRMQ